MVSIMHACKKNKPMTWLLVSAAMLWSAATLADFRISELQPQLQPGSLIISGVMDLALSEKVEEAVSKGIPLDLEIEFRLKRERKLLWAEQLQSWKLKRQIRYHALSGQYFVSDPADSNKKLENFISLQQALRHMGILSELSFDVASLEVYVDASYILEARVSLDIESLPAPLRPVAYTSLDWHLNSGWTTWTVKR